MIKAKGIKDGKPLEVVFDKDGYTFNGQMNELYLYELQYELSMCHAVGGTFFPPRDSLMNIYNTLQNWFFDYNADMETDEQIEKMESVKGRVY